MKQKEVCPNIRMLVTSTDAKPGRLTVARVRCKQWSCDFCAKRNLAAWRAHLGKTFSRKFPDTKWCFMTITLPPHMHGRDDKGVPELQRIWKRLYDKLRRKYDEKISYVYFYEQHKSGTFHIHALISLGATYDLSPLLYVFKEPHKYHPMHRWLKDTNASLRGGHQTDIRRVYGRDGSSDASAAVMYALAYFAKMKTWDGFKKHARRIGVSQDIGGLPKAQKTLYKWEVRQYLTLADLARHGTIHDTSIGRDIGRGDFSYGFYPPENDE